MTASNCGRSAPRRRERFRARTATLATLMLLASVVASVPAAGGGGFTDTATNTHGPAINALDDMGVLDGTECGDGLFCPDEPIERWVMAVWLIRILGGNTPSGGASRFADVDAGAWWAPFAEQLAARNITAGCKTGPLRFCPRDAVTRGQMATFLVKAFGLAPSGPAGFADTSGNVHQSNIDALAGAGITAGCRTDPLSYCPLSSVTRGQMASFLHRAFLKQKEDTPPDPVEISKDVPDVELTDLTGGESVNLRTLIPGDRAVLLWFWAEW